MCPVSPSLTSSVSLEPSTTLKTASDRFSDKLKAIGGLSVEEFLNTSDQDLPPIRYDFGFPDARCPWYYTSTSTSESNEESVKAKVPSPPPVLPATQQLENACKEASVKVDIQYEDVLEENPGVNDVKMHSVVHIIKSSASRRTYTGSHKHETEGEAREDAAEVALRSGAVSYIMSSLDEPAIEPESTSTEDETDPVKIIENCFAQKRPGLKAPQWFTYETGAALRVQLSLDDNQLFRVYSTPDNTLSDPKLTCAQIAIEGGVLDFIRSSEGHVEDLVPPLLSSSANDRITMWANVQEFIKSLPQPFPEPEFAKSIDRAEMNIMNWYNNIFQEANRYRSSPLQQSFHYLQIRQRHGCLLRIEDPNLDPSQAKNYLVEPRFSKKNKAKLAVCLQAMSEGVGDFFRSFIPGHAKQVTSDMHHYANKIVWPQLMAACRSIGPDVVPSLHFMGHKGKTGCTLKLSIPPLPRSNIPGSMLNKNGEISRKYTVAAEYESNEDARVAVLCEAGHKKVIQFVKQRGNPPRGGGENHRHRASVSRQVPAAGGTSSASTSSFSGLPPRPSPAWNPVQQPDGAHLLSASFPTGMHSSGRPQRQMPTTLMSGRDWDRDEEAVAHPQVDLAYGDEDADAEPGEIVSEVEESPRPAVNSSRVKGKKRKHGDISGPSASRKRSKT
ncbi:hypothetical protein GYMLUDRAFT_69786 [Collybiopsis luxurians FD-317 M1]|nr:hypothetical protein GYMLUDRAFT_69786 [Collybiopsis luxurians FD-317 M1]